MNEVVKRDYVAEFKEAYVSALDRVQKMAEIYVAALDEDLKNKDRFVAECSSFVPANLWIELEAVGRKWKHPKMLLGNTSNSSLIKVLPYSDQERLISGERVEMLTPSGVLMVNIADATPTQASQIIDKANRKIRDVAAQRLYIEANNKRPVVDVESVEMPYTISGGKVHFKKGVTLTRKEIAAILREISQ
jgi:hypothetical protein